MTNLLRQSNTTITHIQEIICKNLLSIIVTETQFTHTRSTQLLQFMIHVYSNFVVMFIGLVSESKYLKARNETIMAGMFKFQKFNISVSSDLSIRDTSNGECSVALRRTAVATPPLRRHRSRRRSNVLHVLILISLRRNCIESSQRGNRALNSLNAYWLSLYLSVRLYIFYRAILTSRMIPSRDIMYERDTCTATDIISS